MISPTSPNKCVSRKRNGRVLRQLTWEITSINSYLEELLQIWAKDLSISGPQWKILMAILDLEDDQGVPVNVVSKLLHVEGSFVTAQSKLLEKMGLLRRNPCRADARVVRLSLSDRATKHFQNIADQCDALDSLIMQDFRNNEIAGFAAQLYYLKKRLKMARLKLALLR